MLSMLHLFYSLWSEYTSILYQAASGLTTVIQQGALQTVSQSNYSQCYACCYACQAPHESELNTGFPTDSHLSDVISSLSQHSS